MAVDATKVTTFECGNDWSSGRRWCGDMEIWRYGDMEIWRWGYGDIRTQGERW
jgi:hypothetical protein